MAVWVAIGAIDRIVRYAEFALKVRNLIDAARGEDAIDFSPLFDEFARLDDELRDIRDAWGDVADRIEELALREYLRELTADFDGLRSRAMTIFDQIRASEEEGGKDFSLQAQSIALFNDLHAAVGRYLDGARIVPPAALATVVLPTIHHVTSARMAGQAEDSKAGLDSDVFQEDMQHAIEMVAEILYDYAPVSLGAYTTSVAEAVVSEQARTVTYRLPPGPRDTAPSYAVSMKVEDPFGRNDGEAPRVWASEPFSGVLPGPGHPRYPGEFDRLAGLRITDRGTWQSLTEDIARGVAERERKAFMKTGFDAILLPFETSITTFRDLAGERIARLDPAILHGDDVITAAGDGQTLFGRAGEDRLVAPAGRVDGGTGDDTLVAEGGTAEGHHGDDAICRVRTGFGGDGDDTLSGAAFADLDGGDGDDLVRGSDFEDDLLGGPGNDWMAAFDDYDHLDGGPGDDTMKGGAGRDGLVGGDGRDRLEGGPDDDDLAGERGDDVVSGGAGNDTLEGGGGDDFLAGGSGNDTLEGGPGDDTLKGNRHDDVLSGGDGADRLIGRSGRDALSGGEGSDVVNGFAGEDTVEGGGGDDRLYGSDGDDALSGGEGRDRIKGNAGDDRLAGEAGDDRLFGGAGSDSFVFRPTFGDDLIGDFEPGVDRIVLRTGEAGAVAVVEHASGDALVVSGEGTIRLWRIGPSELSVDDIVF